MESESNSLQTRTEDFRQAGLAFGISGETVGRMALSPDRALACVEEALRRSGGPGLAVHMFDAGDWPEKPKPQRSTNLSVPPTACSTCGGDRFVVVALRKPLPTSWMMERGIEPNESESFEEYAPCPDCGQQITGVPDPGRVREMMNG